MPPWKRPSVGSSPPWSRPFGPDGDLDLDVARALARHLVANGSEGLVLAGTTGEGPTVNDVERVQLIEAVVDEVGDRASVIATTGTYDTRHSVHLTREARAAGADAFLVVTPYYSKPPAEGIYRHFRAIADVAADLPIVVYNIPQRVVINLPPELLLRLAEIDNVIAVKQATTDIDQAQRIVDGGLALYAGNDDLLVPFGEIGGVRRHLRRLARGGQRHAGAGRSLRRGRHGSRPGTGRRAVAALRRPLGDRQPDPGQGRGRAARLRGRRAAAAAGARPPRPSAPWCARRSSAAGLLAAV